MPSVSLLECPRCGCSTRTGEPMGMPRFAVERPAMGWREDIGEVVWCGGSGQSLLTDDEHTRRPLTTVQRTVQMTDAARDCRIDVGMWG